MSVLAWPLLSNQGLAQQAQGSTAQNSASSEQGLEEVVVTAERREQSALSVPTSIQATTGVQLQKLGIIDTTSLQQATPGLMPNTNNGFVQPYIRGIGNNIFVGADPSVATFIDDVPQIYGAMVDNLIDVQRIEILKGAQGGLYGRNATGGVINIITTQPSTDNVHPDLMVRYGSLHTFEEQAYLNLPINQELAWNLSVYRESHSPYVTNTAPAVPYSAANFPSGSFVGTPQQTANFFNAAQSPPRIDYGDLYSVRSKLLFKPTDDFSFTIAGNFSDKHDSSSGQFVTTTPAYTQDALVGLFSAVGVATNLPPGLIQGASGKWTAGIGVDNFSYIKDYSVSGTAVWNGPGFDLTSISAYRNMQTSVGGDAGTTTVPFVPLAVGTGRDYAYEELRATSTFAGPLKLLGGATYLSNHLEDNTDLYLLSFTIPDATTAVDQGIINWSIYGQAGYDFTDQLNLTVSGRYMRERNHADFTKPIDSDESSVEQHFIPSATLSYQLDHGTAYVRWAEGFKTGGVNIETAPAYFPTTLGSIFKPETVDTYEAGYKNSLLDRRLQFTSAVFYNNYKNLQINVTPRPEYTDISTAILNAAAARTWGIEETASWRIIEPLTLGVNAGYLNAVYTNYQLTNNTVYSNFDQNGRTMLDSPKWQLAFTGDVDRPINGNWTFVANALTSYTSAVVFDYSPLPGTIPDNISPAHWLVNARVGAKTTDGRYGVYLNAENLFNRVYYVGGASSSFGNLLNYGTPRLFLGEVDLHF